MAGSAVSEPEFRFGEFLADGRAHELRRGELIVPLQDQPFRVLAALLDRAGALVTRDELKALVWANDTFVDFDHGLNTAVRKLRDALGDSAAAPRYIETLPKRGYRFILPVERLAAATAPALAGVKSPRERRHRRSALLVAAGLVLFTAIGTGQRLRLGQGVFGDRRSVRPSAEAEDLYLRGKIRMRQESEADVSTAIALLEQATALAPEFAAAQAELSRAYRLRVAQFAPADAIALERAQVAAEKALQLDPNLGESHFAAGQLLWGVVQNRFLAERAIRELRQAIKLNSGLGEAHQYLGQIYLHVGLLDEALSEFHRTLLLQPSDHNAIRRIGIVLVYRGRYEEGLRTFRQAPAEANSSLWHYQVAWVLQYLGKRNEAWDTMDSYLRAHPEDKGGVVTSTRAIWFAKAGDTSRAEADIAAAIAKGKGFIHFHHTAYNVASAYALLGRRDEAIEWLLTTVRTGWPCYPYFASDPNLDRIRRDPRYQRFIADLRVEWEHYRAIP